MNCIFCDIIKGNKPGYFIYQDNKTVALLDVFPVVEGHTMVIPKKHAATVLDYSKDELGEVFETVKKVARALEKTYQTNSFTIGINHGESAGVPHLHVHIIPRFVDDGGGIIQTVVKKTVTEPLENTVEKIIKKGV